VPELPSLPTLHVRPASVNHESTTEFASASPDTHLNDPEAPDALMPQEKQGDSPAQEPPPSSSSVQFIGIYVPDSVDSQVNSQRRALDPTPWESAALPSPEDGTATGPSTFPPKRYAVPVFVSTKQKPTGRAQVDEAQCSGFLILFWTSTE
jgi:hypothetical protein